MKTAFNKSDESACISLTPSQSENGGQTITPTYYAYERTPELDFRIGLHEAGHALCGKVFGLPVVIATIVPDPVHGYGGMVSGNADQAGRHSPERVVSLCDKVRPLMPLVGESRTDVSGLHAHAHFRIIELLAGTESERLFHTDDPPLQAAHDLEEAQAFAGIICSKASVPAFIEFARTEARAILADHSHVVFALAHALVKQRTLEGADLISQIIADAISANAIAIEQKRQADWKGVLENAARLAPSLV